VNNWYQPGVSIRDFFDDCGNNSLPLRLSARVAIAIGILGRHRENCHDKKCSVPVLQNNFGAVNPRLQYPCNARPSSKFPPGTHSNFFISRNKQDSAAYCTTTLKYISPTPQARFV
jgi:hypothetical protein